MTTGRIVWVLAGAVLTLSFSLFVSRNLQISATGAIARQRDEGGGGERILAGQGYWWLRSAVEQDYLKGNTDIRYTDSSGLGSCRAPANCGEDQRCTNISGGIYIQYSCHGICRFIHHTAHITDPDIFSVGL